MSLIEHNLKTLKFSRHYHLDLMKNLSVEQLNKIPEGHKNNIIWNFAHCIVVQKSIIYTLSGLKSNLPKELSIQYRNGQIPERYADADEIKLWKELALSTIDVLEQDYKNSIFQHYKPYHTSTGFNLANADDAITFNNYHEGLHFGVSMSLSKMI